MERPKVRLIDLAKHVQQAVLQDRLPATIVAQAPICALPFDIGVVLADHRKKRQHGASLQLHAGQVDTPAMV